MKTIADFFNSSRWTDSAVLFLRILGGGMLLWHGIMKIQNFDMMADSVPAVMGMSSRVSLILATLVEVGASIFIIVGVLTRLALIAAAFTMCIAAFCTGGGFGELAFMYMGIFVALFIAGPGIYSLDGLLFPRSDPRTSQKIKTY